jgi:hypothetical protein
MIRISAVKRSVVPIASGSRDVKEDLKTIFLHISQAIRNNFRLNQSLDVGKNTDCTALSVIFARPTGLKINTLNK